jgi:hypothetical protein
MMTKDFIWTKQTQLGPQKLNLSQRAQLELLKLETQMKLHKITQKIFAIIFSNNQAKNQKIDTRSTGKIITHY